MGDEEKRDVRRFEPPPWEREAFEALARRKAEEQVALEALTATESAANGSAASTAEALAAEVLAARAAAEAPTAQPAAPEGEDPLVEVAQPVANGPDERQVQVMLLELGREEAAPTGNVQMIARVAAVVTALIGAGMLFAGIVALQKAGGTPVGVMGSGALSVFGMCFMAMAAWVWVRSNRVKGSR
jgi:hypothetical protein